MRNFILKLLHANPATYEARIKDLEDRLDTAYITLDYSNTQREKALEELANLKRSRLDVV